MKRILFTLALIFSVQFSWAAGTTSVPFLNIPVTARAAGMGEAYTAIVDEASAITWNPAAMTQIESKSITLTHTAYLESSNYDYAAYAQNTERFGAWGVGFQYLSYDSIDQSDALGNTSGSFTPSDMAVSLGYARPIGAFSVGLAAKYIKSKILDSANTYAADIGLLSPAFLNERMKLALTVSNLGGKIKYEEQSEDLPMVIKVGSSFQIRPRWIAGLDVGVPKSNKAFVAVGTAYGIKLSDAWGLALRTGYNSRTSGDVSGFTGISFGLGIAYQKMKIDYALVPFGDLGMTHRISLGFDF